MPYANSLLLWWRHLASNIYIYMCARYVHEIFSLITICSQAFMAPNAWSSDHPKYIPSYKCKNIYVYIYHIPEEPARASSPYFLRWHPPRNSSLRFTDNCVICSPAKIVLVPNPGLTDIEDGFRHNSMYVSMEWPVRASPSL